MFIIVKSALRGEKKSQNKNVRYGESVVTFFQATGVCHHGDSPVFFENDSDLMAGAYVIEAKQYHQEFTLNISEIIFRAPTNVYRLFM